MQNFFTPGRHALGVKRSYSDYVFFPEGSSDSWESVSGKIFRNTKAVDVLVKWLRENIPENERYNRFIYVDRNNSGGPGQPTAQERALFGIRTGIFKNKRGERDTVYFSFPTITWF
jgi:hypothetical protein